MLRTLVLFAGLGLVPIVGASPPVATTLVADDGVALSATSYPAASPASPVILLFHQAGSGMSEYAPIAPRLVALGYNAFAIDQRSGGGLFDPPNQTVRRLGTSAPYLDVLHDMDAALAWAKRTYPGAPIFAWGSSYSAALVFAFAAKHPHDVAAVLAFSPGEYLDDKTFVHRAAHRLHVPVFVDSASDPQEEAAAASISAAVRSPIVVDNVPEHGVHGSSTLRDDRDAAGAAENWNAVEAFLARLPRPAKS